MVGSTLGVYSCGLIFVFARTNKRHHHQPHDGTAGANFIWRVPGGAHKRLEKQLATKNILAEGAPVPQ